MKKYCSAGRQNGFKPPLSAGRLEDPEKLAFDIRVLRGAARNRNVAVMVGGWPFLQQPELAYQLGADATAADGPQAVMQIGALLGGARRQIQRDD